MLSTSLTAAGLWRSSRAYQIFGANTNVGKTVVSTVLCKAIPVYQPKDKLWFLKPVAAGPEHEADDRHINRFAKDTFTKCLYNFDEPVSPHLAAAQNKHRPSDNEILKAISTTLNGWAEEGPGVALVETAGGVLSPGPNSSLQADLYRPLRLPVVLVADAKLGGISASISAYESLVLRGYDVEGVILFEDQYYQNHDFLREFFQKKNVKLFSLPSPPPSLSPEASQNATEVKKDEEAMGRYYEKTMRHDEIQGLLEELRTSNHQRIERLESMSKRAHELVWYPFTQHHSMTPRDISVIDSAYNDCFQTLRTESNGTVSKTKLLQSSFDGSASWWTQGLGHGNPTLALTAAYAAGRYGHVMFAGTIHEPALALAETLLDTLKNPRLEKVFYTDNGSTGMEVAVKMGLRASCVRYDWDASKESIGILGLRGSYHGDTIGVMDCSEPSTYNKKVEWYRGRGHWFDFPRVKMSKGTWSVAIPDTMRDELGEDVRFQTLSSVFDLEQRKSSGTAKRYKEYIKTTIEDLVMRQGRKFGAVMLEPIILGAGGMLFCDPLFQSTLVQVVRENPQIFGGSATTTPASSTSWSGLPVIFDEVFTGLYRLGRHTSASFLDVDPDVTVNAKLLTGGLVPLCTTLASEEIFKAFDSPHKSDALLHGHSYTANPVGCATAVESLRTMTRMKRDGHWSDYVQDWNSAGGDGMQETTAKTRALVSAHEGPWSCWSQDLVRDLSFAGSVESIFALGSVLSITLRDQEGGGYNSNAASGLRKFLTTGNEEFNIHCRVLGNVLYLMGSVTSKREVLQKIEGLLRESLL